MRRLIIAVPLIMLLLESGCFWRAQHGLEERVATGLHDIEQQAEQVLDFLEARREEPPVLDRDPDAAAKLWQETSFPERREAILALKQHGGMGENNRGRLELRECETLSDPEAWNEAQKLLAQENKDRKALYKEIARQNRAEKISVAEIERIFVMKRLSRAKSGECFQLPADEEDFTEFKASRQGKRLGDACVPEAWVVFP